MAKSAHDSSGYAGATTSSDDPLRLPIARQPLEDGWTVELSGRSGVDPPAAIEGAVWRAAIPGCVHLDLEAEELIPSLSEGDAEARLRWISGCDWTYTCSFTAEPRLLDRPRVDLVCKGLDTLAELSLNDQPIGIAANMHRTHRFDVRGPIRPGVNTCRIQFRGVGAAVAQGMPVRRARWAMDPSQPPFAPTCGIWRPVRLEGWRMARIAAVRPIVTEANEQRARVRVRVQIERQAGPHPPLRVSAMLVGPSGQDFAHDEAIFEPRETAGELETVIEQPRLWRPVGYGDQPLYRLVVRLTEGSAREALDEWTGRVGLRRMTVEPAAADGTDPAIRVRCNDQPIRIVSAEWPPAHTFQPATDLGRYRQLVELALAAHVNLLHVTDDGIYESETFYDLCDELGMLVCQRFPRSPGDEAATLQAERDAEALEHVPRLATHPSLAAWVVSPEAEDPVARQFIAAASELDPGRPVLRHAAPPTPATPPAAPAPATWQRVLPPDARHLDAPSLRLRAPAGEPADAGDLAKRVEQVFGPLPRDRRAFDAWAYLSGVLHARHLDASLRGQLTARLGVEAAAEAVHVGPWHEPWPAISPAIIDGDVRRRPAWYVLRRLLRGRPLAIRPLASTPGDGRLELVAANPAPRPWNGVVQVQRMTFSGEMLAEVQQDAEIPGRSARLLLELPAELAISRDPAREMIRASLGDERVDWFFDLDHRLEYPTARFETTLAHDGPLATLTVTAKTLLRDVCLFPDRLHPDALVSDQMITLIPGESCTFRVRGLDAGHADRLAQPPCLQCVNGHRLAD